MAHIRRDCMDDVDCVVSHMDQSLKQAFASERDLIMKAVADGIAAYHENLCKELEPEIVALKDKVKMLEADIAGIKAKQKKWGWFS
jgi:hypothetical protein